MAKHYIRKNETNDVIYSFSTDFEQPKQGDMCVNENGGRHFQLDLMTDKNGMMLYKYLWDGKKYRLKTDDELLTPDVEKQINNKQVSASLQALDQQYVRCLEDLIETLVEKDIIAWKDLPASVKKKTDDRKNERKKLK